MAKVIFHIDLNSFFASAEVLRNTALEGQPIVVGGLSKRGVVCTASYEARNFGVRSAMPLYQALSLCPDLIVVKGDQGWYEELSKRFFNFIKTYTPYIEVASIDECYVDVTTLIKNYNRPLDLAWDIQRELKEKVGLPCSIGVAPNKFLAKMASDMRKPMGISVLRKQEVMKKLWPLSIDEMFGIGKKSAPLLKQAGILCIGDIAKSENRDILSKVLGKQCDQIVQNVLGNGSDVLVYNTTVQSISQSTTINHDVEEYTEMKSILKVLVTNLSKRAEADKIEGKMISISVRYFDFRNIVRSLNLDTYTNDVHIIYENALLLLDQNFEPIPIRHLGIGLGSLNSKEKKIEQLSIFNKAKPEVNVLEELNKNISGTKLMYASNLLKKTNK